MSKLFIVEKVRELPETNSSSSHVYYLGDGDKNKINKVKEELIKFLSENDNKLVLHPEGETQFGWECDSYTDWESLYNWLIIVAYRYYYDETNYKNEDIMNKLLKRIKEFTGINDISIYSKNECEKELNDNRWSYVDHQSVNIPIEYINDDYINLGEILTG